MNVAYVRCSKGEQQDAGRQRDAIESKYKVDRWYEDTEGSNSRDRAEKRVQFQQMLADVRSGKVKRIYVAEQDRFGMKHHLEFASAMLTLQRHAVDLVDVRGSVLSGTDPAAIFLTAANSVVSTQEQKSKSERSITAKVRHAREGRVPGGVPAYGLDIVCLRDGEEVWRVVYYGRDQREQVFPDGSRQTFNGKGNMPSHNASEILVYRPSIIQERIDTILRIYQLCAAGHSPQAICTLLNREGISAVCGKFHKVKLRAWLSNPAYIGYPTWNKRGGSRFTEYVNGEYQDVPENSKNGRKRAPDDYVRSEEQQFDPIVPVELFNLVQERLAERAKGTRRPARTAQLYLKPLMVCKHCGKHMRASGQLQSYICSSYANYGKDSGCRHNAVKHAVVEYVVKQYLENISLEVLPRDPKPESREGYLQIEATSIWLDMCIQEDQYEEEHGERKDYGEILAERLPALQKEHDEKEAHLAAALNAFAKLSPALRQSAQKAMETMQAELDAIRLKMTDLRVPLDEKLSLLEERRAAYEQALQAWRDGENAARYDALSKVIDRIEVEFKYKGDSHSVPDTLWVAAKEGSRTPSAPGPG